MRSRILSTKSIGVIASVMALALALPGVATASTQDEVAQGQQLAQGIQSGSVTCSDLDETDFAALGEYAMNSVLGDAQHAAMNARMEQAMGTAATERMHVAAGERFSGCGARDSGSPAAGGMMGGGYPPMMGAPGAHPPVAGWTGYGPMMDSGDDGADHMDGDNVWVAGLAGLIGALIGAAAAYFALRRRSAG